MNARSSTQTLALLPDANTRQIAEHLVAFANTDGGTIVMGFDERGKMTSRVMPEDIDQTAGAGIAGTVRYR